MNSFVDFAEVKEATTAEDVAKFLNLNPAKSGDKWRCLCPICHAGGDRALVITPSKRVYFCFGGCKKGGDFLTLVSKARNISTRDAALALSGGTANVTAPTLHRSNAS